MVVLGRNFLKVARKKDYLDHQQDHEQVHSAAALLKQAIIYACYSIILAGVKNHMIILT